jgi:hypothetical protein
MTLLSATDRQVPPNAKSAVHAYINRRKEAKNDKKDKNHQKVKNLQAGITNTDESGLKYLVQKKASFLHPK